MTCPECGGQIQLTRKSYYNVVGEPPRIEDTGYGADLDVYCENDHPITDSATLVAIMDAAERQGWKL